MEQVCQEAAWYKQRAQNARPRAEALLLVHVGKGGGRHEGSSWWGLGGNRDSPQQGGIGEGVGWGMEWAGLQGSSGVWGQGLAGSSSSAPSSSPF